MTTYFLTYRKTGPGHSNRPLYSGIRVLDGSAVLDGTPIGAGQGAYVGPSAQLVVNNSTFLEYGLSATPPNSDFETMQAVEFTGETALFRLDEVSFGPGVCAYRHVHPGAGFRALIEGELTIHADDHSQVMRPGDVWFEPANSPVRAVASETEPQTTFVRAMLLPPECLGQPTIHILDPDEAALPRLQKTQRHFDQIIQLSG